MSTGKDGYNDPNKKFTEITATCNSIKEDTESLLTYQQEEEKKRNTKKFHWYILLQILGSIMILVAWWVQNVKMKGLDDIITNQSSLAYTASYFETLRASEDAKKVPMEQQIEKEKSNETLYLALSEVYYNYYFYLLQIRNIAIRRLPLNDTFQNEKITDSLKAVEDSYSMSMNDTLKSIRYGHLDKLREFELTVKPDYYTFTYPALEKGEGYLKGIKDKKDCAQIIFSFLYLFGSILTLFSTSIKLYSKPT